MKVTVREYRIEDLPQLRQIWNEVVEEGTSFPQMDTLDEAEAEIFFSGQSFTGVAKLEADTGTETDPVSEIVGLYILHPNNVGRCGHIANSSYAVKSGVRGLHIGEKLVVHSLEKAKELGYGILQFNAVVKTNERALRLYEKLGFQKLGVIPGGFLMKDGHYEDIIPHYHVL